MQIEYGIYRHALDILPGWMNRVSRRGITLRGIGHSVRIDPCRLGLRGLLGGTNILLFEAF